MHVQLILIGLVICNLISLHIQYPFPFMREYKAISKLFRLLK